MKMLSLNKIFLALTLVLMTCCTPTYIRHTDIHHSKYIVELKINNNKVEITSKSPDNTSISTFSYVVCADLKTDSARTECLIFLENKKVIYFNKSYWIKKGVSDSTTNKYINKDLKF